MIVHVKVLEYMNTYTIYHLFFSLGNFAGYGNNIIADGQIYRLIDVLRLAYKFYRVQIHSKVVCTRSSIKCVANAIQ